MRRRAVSTKTKSMKQRWVRRERKKRRTMKLHGRGIKRLIQRLQERRQL